MEKTMSKSVSHTLSITYIALAAALIAVCSWISIPTTVPFTLQTFAVCLTTALLGLRRGTLAVIVYLCLGAVGLPVFAGFKGGIASLAGPTGGYLIGFIFTALIVGIIADRFGRKPVVLVIAMILGIAVCYAFGTAWFVPVYTKAASPIGIAAALSMCVFPFIIPDLIKIAVATLLVNRLHKYIK
jgi:biotin transport system substrate-specific component